MSLSSQIGPLAQCDAEKLGKKLIGENEVDAALQRLDRLSRDEARATATQTLEVVYHLVQYMKAVMDSE